MGMEDTEDGDSRAYVLQEVLWIVEEAKHEATPLKLFQAFVLPHSSACADVVVHVLSVEFERFVIS